MVLDRSGSMDFVVGAAASKSTLWSLLSSSRDLLNQREFGCFLFVATPTKNLRIIPIVTIPSPRNQSRKWQLQYLATKKTCNFMAVSAPTSAKAGNQIPSRATSFPFSFKQRLLPNVTGFSGFFSTGNSISNLITTRKWPLEPSEPSEHNCPALNFNLKGERLGSFQDGLTMLVSGSWMCFHLAIRERWGLYWCNSLFIKTLFFWTTILSSVKLFHFSCCCFHHCCCWNC